MFKKLLMAATLVASIHGFAGQDGNGGFGINCNGKVEILDLYEAKARYNYTIDLGPLNMSVDQKVEKMLKRLERINKLAADRYREQYANLWQRADILKGQKLIKNNDTIAGTQVSFALDVGVALVPEGCNLIPLARNIDDASVSKNIYFIGKYWEHLNNNTRAALILHELIYFDSISGNLKNSGLGLTVEDSSSVRKLIGLLSSKESEKLNLIDLLKQIMIKEQSAVCHSSAYPYICAYSHSHLINFQMNGFLVKEILIDPKSLKLSNDGTYIKEANIITLKKPEFPQEREFLGKKLLIFLIDTYNTKFFDKDTPNAFTAESATAAGESFIYPIRNGSLEFTIDTYSAVELWQPNKIRSLNFIKNSKITSPFIGKLNNVIQIALDKDGNITYLYTADNKELINLVKDISFERYYHGLNFHYTNSKVDEMYTEDISVKVRNFKEHRFLSISRATLRPDGTLKCASLSNNYEEAKINGVWTAVTKSNTIEFNDKNTPIGLNCKIPNYKRDSGTRLFN